MLLRKEKGSHLQFNSEACYLKKCIKNINLNKKYYEFNDSEWKIYKQNGVFYRTKPYSMHLNLMTNSEQNIFP